MVKTQAIKKISEYSGLPKLTDYKFVEEDVSETLQDGEMLTETLMISVDPYLRVYPMPAGTIVSAFQLAKVLESKSSKYPKGSIVYQNAGWQKTCKVNEAAVWSKFQEDSSISKEDFMSSIGMCGISAYFGFLDICKPKKGETVMVSGCMGAVGSVVGQIAKIYGCRVIGSCGSEAKVKRAKSIGYDDAFNYKSEKDWGSALKRLAPEGIDCYFDNVGGDMSYEVMKVMKMDGRISCCGAISVYNNEGMTATGPVLQPLLVMKRLKMQGFNVVQYLSRKQEAITDLTKWTKEGKLKGIVHVTHGFENVPAAFIGMLNGENTGKAFVEI